MRSHRQRAMARRAAPRRRRPDAGGGRVRVAPSRALRAALLASSTLIAAALPAAAQDATWLLDATVAGPVAGTFDFNAGANWNPAAVPTGTAFFGTSNTPDLSFSANTTIGGWTFNAGASNYNFTNGLTLRFNGAGITINGGSATITNNDTLDFRNASTAGSATFTNGGSGFLEFFDTSTAGNATITNTGLLRFNDSSTAGSATITNNLILEFFGTSTAASATITNNDLLRFFNTSTAGGATITNSGAILFLASSSAADAAITNNNQLRFISFSTAGSATITNNGFIFFENSSSAANAVITNNGAVTFTDTSSAGSSAITNNGGGSLVSFTDSSSAANATITTNGGALTQFTTNSTGGNAQFITAAGGIVDFSGTSGPAGNNQLTAGSIAGAGAYRLGANQLTVGGNNLSTTVSGTIEDGGTSGGTGASLVKVGTGTLTLSGANTYSGGTTINGGTLAVSADNNLGDGAGALAFGGGTLQFLSDFTTNRAVALNAAGGTFDTNGNRATVAGTMGGTGGLTKIGAGTLTLTGNNSYLGGTTINGGTLAVAADNNLGAAASGLAFGGAALQFLAGFTTNRAIALNAGGGIVDTNGNSATLAGTIGGTGGLTKIGAGTLTLSGANTYSGGTTLAAGTLRLENNSALGNGALTTTGSVVDYANGVTIANPIVVNSNTTQLQVTTGSATQAGVISELNGPRPIEKIGAGTLILTAANTYSGPTTISAGTLQLGNGGTSGSILGNVINNGIFAINRSDVFTFGNVISGTGAFQQNGTGATVLTATNTYGGPTSVNAGALVVNGSIASSAVTVNNGALLTGTGAVGATTVNAGGTFAPGSGTPGSSMTVAGNLAFQSGALYLVQINPSNASSANVTTGGSAALAGTVNAAFASGGYVSRTYTILSAAGGRNGTFNALATTNLPAGFTANLSYTASDVILNLTATLGQQQIATGGLSINQRNVANSLNNFFNSGGALPPAFVSVFGLTGGNLGNALSQLSGEAATGAQQAAFQLGNQFLTLMLDPFVDGRSGFGGNGPAAGGAIGFAPEREAVPEEVALAYAAVLKAPKKAPPQTFEQRWGVWGAGYGGSNRTTGDPAVLGSHDLSARTAGFAGGFDYRLSRDTVVGIAFAGAGTDWSVAQGLGGGKSDAFQAGVYGVTRWDALYLAASFAYTNHWMSTDRIAFAGDHLTAKFNAQSLGGRLEGGYRLATMFGALTPYAAVQVQSFRTPSYSETDVNGGGFALAYNSRTGTDTRSELGARFDRLVAVSPTAALALRARLAWAHDWVSDPTLAAVFQTLPGASFIVNGAVPARNSALASAGAELRLANGVSLLGKFDGEFARGSSTYAGTGTVRYAW